MTPLFRLITILGSRRAVETAAREHSSRRELFARRCDACHRAGEAARALTAYPRAVYGRVEPLEEFLERHRAEEPLAWDSQATADLIAYLTEESR